MITLSVDEAYAFDFLSILEVKINTVGDYVSYEKCLEELKKQLGEKVTEIVQSKEYYDMVYINRKIYNMVDRIRAGEPISGKEVDAANTERFVIKKELQKRFFGNDVQERKN